MKLVKGLLITVEGIDGSGKSTLARALADHLRQLGLPVLLTREPGATQLGQHIRSLLHERTAPISPEAEFLLFAADRAQHISTLVAPALAQKSLVISDRMADSSLAYQGYGRGLDKAMITTINSWAMQGIAPDVTIYLRTGYNTAMQRLHKRNEHLTAFEAEHEQFFTRVSAGFEAIMAHRANVLILDGEDTQEHLVQDALSYLQSYLYTS